MRDSIRVAASSFLALIVVSILFLSTANAVRIPWQGNDDGEFDNGACCGLVIGNVNAEGWFHYQAMRWSSPNNVISFQYNPDLLTSRSNQRCLNQGNFCLLGGDWFQTAIGVNQAGCVDFAIEVFDYNNHQDFDQHYPSTQPCNVVPGGSAIFGWNSAWHINQYINVSGANPSHFIYDVTFELWAFGYNIYSYDIAVSQTNPGWYWIKSNICWCGTDYYSATILTGGGPIGDVYITTQLHLKGIDPPGTTSTGENSNMQYGCWQYSGSNNNWLFQTFGLSVQC